MNGFTLLLSASLLAGPVPGGEPVITTVAGGGTTDLGDGGPAVLAKLSGPTSVAVDSRGNLYIAEGYGGYGTCRIRKVSPSGVITTFAGDGTYGNDAGENVPATSVSVCAQAITVDAAGNVYTAEQTRVRRIGTNGLISTFAGTGEFGYSGDGGPATQARIGPTDIAIDTQGRLYIVERYNQRIRRVGTGGIIRTIAGNGDYFASGDGGPALQAGMSPVAIAVDASGTVYFSDQSRETIRRITPDGIVHRVAGNGPFRSDPLAINSNMYFPLGLATDTAGNVYVANEANLVHVISPQGILKVIAGDYNDSDGDAYGAWWGYGGDGGAATAAVLNRPSDVAVDAQGNFYIADTDNNRIRKVTRPDIPALPTSAGAFRDVAFLQSASYNGPPAIGDFNGDGRLDVVMWTGSAGGDAADPENDDRLLLFLQRRDGGLADPLRISVTPQCSLSDLRAVDLDRDGLSDLLCGNREGIAVFFATGTGFRAGPLLKGEANAEIPVSFITGDVDLDGRPDVVAWMAGRSEGGSWPTDRVGITIFYGVGAGGATRRVFMPQSNFAGRLAWGDVNRDGRVDLLSTWVEPGLDSGVSVFLHDGVDGFRAPSIVRVGKPGFGSGITTGDFDGDGHLDVVVGGGDLASQSALARLRVGDDSRLALAGIERTYDAPADLVAADIDNDGRDDLLIHHSGKNAIGYRRQIGAPSQPGLDAEVKYWVRTSVNGRGAMAVGDLDGDGCRDVAYADSTHGLHVLYATSCFATPAPRGPLLPGETAGTMSGSATTAPAAAMDAARAGDAASGVVANVGHRVRAIVNAMRVALANRPATRVAGASATLLLLLAFGSFLVRSRRI